MAQIEFPIFYSVLQQFADELLTNYQTKVIDNNLLASDQLLTTAKTSVKIQGSIYMVAIDLQDYWKYIENGRKPGSKFPPPEAILNWIRIKPIIPHENSLGTIPTENQLAFLIGRSIAQKGIEQKPILSESVQETVSNFEKSLTEALAQDLAILLKSDFDTILSRTKFNNLTIKNEIN